jgi:cellulose synthase/poly-beta-1,6-N-acetylglucosamine synthase-like glycosyltransferase
VIRRRTNPILGALSLVVNLGLVLVVVYASILGWASQFWISMPSADPQQNQYFFLSISLYGGVVVVRTCLQMLFARRNQTIVRKLNRDSIGQAITIMYPEWVNRLSKLNAKSLRFDDWREQIFLWLIQRYGDDQKWEMWQQIVDMSLNILYGDDAHLTGGLVVPMYKTPLEQLRALTKSTFQQTLRFAKVVIVLNQEDYDLLEKIKVIVEEETGGDWDRYEVLMEPTKGKRNAMYKGFRRLIELGVDYIFNADSDSYLDLDAHANFMRVAFQTGLGCATGDVRVWNVMVNLLTRITGHRYSQAFNIERAAQSLFGAVTCMSGPFLGVRREVLELFLESWVHQMYLGKLCNFGDDRNISTNILRLGFLSLYIGESIVYTDAPEQFKVWRVQQTRWSRSANRETIISIPFLHRIPMWVQLDMIYQFMFPFVLFIILISIMSRTASIMWNDGFLVGLLSLVPYITIVLTLNWLFRGLYGYLSYNDKWYITSPLYIVLHYGILLPIKFYALITPLVNEWGTK